MSRFRTVGPSYAFGNLVVFLLTLSTLPAWSQPRLFGTTGFGSGSSSTLVEIDPTDGSMVTIGPVGYAVNGLTWDTTSGKLYAGTSYKDSFNGLIEIDVTTGAGTPAGAPKWGQGGALAVTNLTSDSAGRLFGWSEWCDCLVSIDKATGVATEVGGSGISSYSYGLSFDGSDVLHLVNGDGSVYTVNTATGLASYQGSIGTIAHHGDFHPVSGLWYGLSTTGDPRSLLTANLGTGAVATVGAVGTLHTLTFVSDVVTKVADVSVSKSVAPEFLQAGGTVIYTIVVSNGGPSDVEDAAVTDSFADELGPVTWTCLASGGATCTAAGTGDIDDTVDLPSGGSVTYTATTTPSVESTMSIGNVATVTLPAGITNSNPANQSSSATLTVMRPIPSLGDAELALLALLLAVAGGWIARRMA